jgi:hypothetical protein
MPKTYKRSSGGGFFGTRSKPRKSASMSRPASGWYMPFTNPPKKGFVPKRGSKSASKYR